MKNGDGAPETLQQAVIYFSDPDRALEFMVSIRWPEGVICPRCAATKVKFLATRRLWKCYGCTKQFSVKVGTIFEDSPIALEKWLPCLWLIANCKNGISSYEVSRALGVTQKTAWFMLHRVRLAMQSEAGGKKFGGDVEVDETFIGGASRFMHDKKRQRVIKVGNSFGKVAVMGFLERHHAGHSRVRAFAVPSRKKGVLQAKVRENVRQDAFLYSDALKSYDGLEAEYIHQVIDHNIQYVDGLVHTNGLENFWSLLKRSLKGTYVSVEPFHLFRYVDEQVFRFNNRHDDDGGRFESVAQNVVGKRVTYKALTGADATEPDAR